MALKCSDYFIVNPVVDFDLLVFRAGNYVLLVFSDQELKDRVSVNLFDFTNLDAILKRDNLNPLFIITTHVKNESIITEDHEFVGIFLELFLVF